MDLNTFYDLIKAEFNIPIAYDHFNEPPTTPFIAYLDIGKDTFNADNCTFTKSTNIVIELYTDYKDLELEAKLESFLEKNFRYWEDEATVFIPEEKLYLHAYRFKI